MIKKPTLPYLKLWELAKEWNKKFKDCDLSDDDILGYGINGDLTICAVIPHNSKTYEFIDMDREYLQQNYPDQFNDLSEKEKQEDFLGFDIMKYIGPHLEPLQKKDLQTIHLEGTAKLMGLQDPCDPNRTLFNLNHPPLDDKAGPFLSLTKNDLCVLREDITAFEEKYFLQEEPKNTIDKTNILSTAITKTTKEITTHNNTDHNSFAPELAIANEIWNYLYVENQIKRGKNIKSQVAAWLKNNKDKYAKYFIHIKGKDFPSQELCKRLSTVITPQVRKGGGVESIE